MGCAGGYGKGRPEKKESGKCGAALLLPLGGEVNRDVVIQPNRSKDLLIEIPSQILKGIGGACAISAEVESSASIWR